jgi:tRNA pseudouridine38-40 synthase
MKQFHYLLEIQFLGFRLHGWQKQSTTHRTIQGMLERTLKTVLGHENFKTLGASRTDSMVSSLSSLCKLTIKDEDIDPDILKKELNLNLPADIKIKDLQRTTDKLRIINDLKIKEYRYHFCNEKSPSPLIAPYMVNFNEPLNFELMQKCAKLFEGKHNFKHYCFRGNDNKIYEREIITSEVKINTELTASFFPDKSFVYIVKGGGFMRHQVRLMVGTIIMAGAKQIKLEEVSESLKGDTISFKNFVAPSSGLILFKTQFI